jgi:hypothetical protein
MKRRSLFLGLLAYLVSGAVQAEDVGVVGAKFAVGMFTNCVKYAGDPAGLREWISESGMKPAPSDLAAQYLGGHPGKVFGGEGPAGVVAIGSQDDGGCTLFADSADSDATFQAFEEWLSKSKLSYAQKPAEKRSEGKLSMESRDYEVTGSGRRWRIVVSTSPQGKGRFQAIMTAYGTPADPEKH